MLLKARRHPNTSRYGIIRQHGRVARGMVISTMAAALSVGSASVFSAEATEAGSTTKTWSNQVRDYATESLNDEQALSLAAIPMNGPGIEQYINADALMSPGSIMKLVTTDIEGTPGTHANGWQPFAGGRDGIHDRIPHWSSHQRRNST